MKFNGGVSVLPDSLSDPTEQLHAESAGMVGRSADENQPEEVRTGVIRLKQSAISIRATDTHCSYEKWFVSVGYGGSRHSSRNRNCCGHASCL